MYTLSLEIINKCNLNCTYCYLGEKNNTVMGEEIIKRAINLAVHEACKQYDKTLTIYFIGGEPLLSFNNIKFAVKYVKEYAKETALHIRYSTTINGTLLNEEIVHFFIENNFDVKLSLDGNKRIHDLNRKYYSGTGSFDAIIQGVPLLKKFEQETGKNISVAHVITKNNYMDLKSSFEFLVAQGFTQIESGFDHYCNWSLNELEYLQKEIEDLFYYYIDYSVRTKRQLYWNLYEQHLLNYVYPVCFFACKAGLSSVYVNTEGNIYTCTVLDEFHIGDVYSGLNVQRIRDIVHTKDKKDVCCAECKYTDHCKSRGCLVSNFEINHDIYKPVTVSCFVTKVFYELIESNFTKKQLDQMKTEYEGRKNEGKTASYI